MTDHTDLIPIADAGLLVGLKYRAMKLNVEKASHPAPHVTIGTHKYVIRSELAGWNLERLRRKRGER